MPPNLVEARKFHRQGHGERTWNKHREPALHDESFSRFLILFPRVNPWHLALPSASPPLPALSTTVYFPLWSFSVNQNQKMKFRLNQRNLLIQIHLLMGNDSNQRQGGGRGGEKKRFREFTPKMSQKKKIHPRTFSLWSQPPLFLPSSSQQVG